METPKKQKLLIVITKSNFGGAQRYVYDVARSLTDAYDVLVACGGEGLMKTRIEETGVRTVSIPYLGRDVNPFKDLLVFFWLIGLLRRERPQILHVNSSKIGGIGGFAGRIMRIPQIIFTAHAWAFNEDRSIIARGAIFFLHWFTVLCSHVTIAVSEGVAKSMREMPFVTEKIRLVRNGIAPIAFLDRAAARAELAKRVQVALKGTLVGTISELHPSKGIDFMIEAAAAAKEQLPDLPGFAFVVIGGGDPIVKAELERLIVARGVADRVFLAGFVPDASRLLPAFDIATLTSRTEALGYFLLEAGQAGLPVIASAVGGIPELVSQLETGVLVKPGNTKELRDALAFFLKEPEKARALGERLREKVASEYSLDRMKNATLGVYLNK